MKRVLFFLQLALGFLLVVQSVSAKTVEVVTTIGPITDVVENVGGERLHLQGLMGPGVDPHLYRAKESDVRKLSKADIIFYGGLHLEAKMAEVFEKMERTKKTVAVTDNISRDVLLDNPDFPGTYDPHVWFDVTLWSNVTEKIRDELVAFDPEGKDFYTQRAEIYLQKLQSLHKQVLAKSAELDASRRVIITAHDAFRYFGRAYSFEVIGLQGISTETEAGAKDVMKLADFIAERKVKSIFVETSISERSIKAVQEAVRARGWDVQIGGQLYSDALGTAGTKEGTYIGMVEHNINTIVDALK